MTFAWPLVLLLLAFPVALLVWECTHRRRVAARTRPKILRAEAGPHSLRLTAPGAASSTAARPRFWLCLGLALALFAAARPQWGRLEEPVFDQSREILIAIDLSRSMLTPDVKPSRLERAKLLIQSLLERLAGERVGLAVFAGTAFLQSPLSGDYEILREFLPALGPDFLPEGGSNYGALLETALQAFGTTTSADRFLIILSDGEATDDDWKARVEELKKKNIRVLGLGVGTAGGGMIPDGTGQFVKDERGAVVLSKLEGATLQELAQATGGVYRDASAWVDLAALVNETIETARAGEFVEKHTVRLVERFQWPLAFGVWCLLMSLCYEFPVRPRPRAIALRPAGDAAGREQGAGSREQEKTPASATATLASLILAPCSLLLAPPAAHAAEAAPPEPPPLVRIVTRLAGAERHSARDWAELGRETVNWGSRLQSEKQPVPEGPVRDALAAADLGRKLDAKATDWAKLREELEALLQKPEEEKQDQQNQEQQQNQDDQQQDQSQQEQDKKSEKQKQDKSQQQQQSKSDQPDQQDQAQQEPQDAKPPEPKPQGESAFGDMNKKEEPPPPPPQSTQKVGGAPEKKDEAPPPPTDPALALPLQKLEQLRDQDSPAQLFQLMEGEKKPARKTGKDW